MTTDNPAQSIKGFLSRICRRMGVVVTALVSISLYLPALAADFKDCTRCHKLVQKELLRPNIHIPFLQQRCGECHLPKGNAPSPENSSSTPLKDRRKISWLGESRIAAASHGFVLPAEKVGQALVVELQEGRGAFTRRKIAVPPLGGLAEVADSGKPPAISGTQVLRVERGVFLSATIGWQTDTLADALVRYGTGELTQTAQAGNRFGRRHEVVLNNLKPGKTYRFMVVSRDIFARSQTSEALTFSTDKPLPAPLPNQSGLRPSVGEGPDLVSRFQRLGTGYLLELTLETPASVFVGVDEMATKPPDGSAGGRLGDDRFHTDLSSKQVVSMWACRGCHTDQATATHPVNVYPKPGMIIPPEYPTLPDGRITCRSCHETHSSENEYLTIKGGRRELCVGCHKDML